MENLEMEVMNLILASGNGKSCAMEAIQYAKAGEFDKAEQSLEESVKELSEAHHVQTALMQREINGEKIDMGILMVHAQDHLMTSLVVKDMAAEIVELYKKMG